MINHHCVPDFEMDEDYSFPTSSSAVSRSRKSPLPENEIMELLWQNGQVVMQSQNQRSIRRSPPSKLEHENNDSNNNNNNHLFMQEDEMAAWLHYPLDEDNFCAQLELLDNNNFNNMNMSSQSQTTTQTNINPMVRTSQPQPQPQPPPSRPPIPPSRRSELAESKVSQFPSRQKGYYYDEETNKRMAAAAAVRESSTIVDSNETPETWAVVDKGCATMSGGGAEVAVTSSGGGGGGGGGGSKVEMVTCELTVTSSPGCSSASAEAGQKEEAAGEDRKRKSMEADDADADDDADAECHSEDVEFESADAKKQVRGSTSTKRSRAAEVHNLSERRRRDRINEKMKALQELIPRCNKSDKASMLDEAIEYLKSLQLQVQMMSMGCGMFPMIFPGVQQYMPTMGMGIGMGMGMGMEMGINRPMFPFPNMLAGSGLPTGAAAHLGPRFPMPAFMPHVPVPDPSRIQSNQSEQMLNSLGAQHPSQSWFPNFTDPYQQYVAPHQMQLPLSQNQAMAQPSTSKPSTSRGPENLDNNQSG